MVLAHVTQCARNLQMKVARKLTTVAGLARLVWAPEGEVSGFRLRFRRSTTLSSPGRSLDPGQRDLVGRSPTCVPRSVLYRCRLSAQPGSSHKSRCSQPHGGAGVPSASRPNGTDPQGLVPQPVQQVGHVAGVVEGGLVAGARADFRGRATVTNATNARPSAANTGPRAATGQKPSALPRTWHQSCRRCRGAVPPR